MHNKAERAGYTEDLFDLTLVHLVSGAPRSQLSQVDTLPARLPRPKGNNSLPLQLVLMPDPHLAPKPSHKS